MDLRNMTLDQLYDLHTSLCDAHTALHAAWRVSYQATKVPGNELDRIARMVSTHIIEVGDRIDALAPQPLPVIDVPLARDTTPYASDAPRVLADYHAYDEDGTLVTPGDEIMDFRGDKWEFVSVSRAPEYGKSAKVTALRNGDRSKFYAHVFNLTVS